MSWAGIFFQASLMLCGMTDVANSNVCVDYYTPVEGTAIRTVEAFEATWSAIDQLCKNTHFSYNLAQRGAFLKAPRQSQGEQLCDYDKNGVLPLRMKKAINRTVYWINDYGIENEKLTPQELALIDPTAMDSLNMFGGSVFQNDSFSLTFVSRTHTFNCAVCEILRRKSLLTPFGPLPPSPDTTVEYWAHLNAVVASPIETIRRDLAIALNVPVSAITHVYTQRPQETTLASPTATLTPATTSSPTTATTTTPTTTTGPTMTKPERRRTTKPTTSIPTTPKKLTTEMSDTGTSVIESTSIEKLITWTPNIPEYVKTRYPDYIDSYVKGGHVSSSSSEEEENSSSSATTLKSTTTDWTTESLIPTETTYGSTPTALISTTPPNWSSTDKTTTTTTTPPGSTESTTSPETTTTTSPPWSSSDTTITTTTSDTTSTIPSESTTEPLTDTTPTDTTTTTPTVTTATTTTTTESSAQTTGSVQPTGGSSTLEAGREVQVYLITRTYADRLLPHLNDISTPVYFSISSIDGNHYCVGEAIDDAFGNRHYWPDTKPGVVVVKRNKKSGDTTLTSRECTYNIEHIASWTEPAVWIETWKDCSSPIAPGGDDEETLDNASEYLENLAAVPALSRQLEDIADVVNEVLLLDEQVLENNDNSTTQILRDLETIVSNMVIETGDVVNSTQSNLALVVSDVQSSTDTLVGITISTADDSGELVLELVRSSTPVKITNQTQVRTVLSAEMVRRHTRLAFMVFPDGKLFPTNRGSKYRANSHVINIIMVNDNLTTHNLDDEYIDIAFQPLLDVPGKNSICGYWDFTKNDWESSGCVMLNTSNSHLDVCRCSHLTNFAEIITGGSTVIGANARALDIISLVGCTFSMSALLAIALTAVLFEHWRRELSNKILLHMSAAIALNLIAFFLVASVQTTPESVECIAIGVLLHYSVLTCFFWMLVMSTLQLLRLVTMMGAKAIPNLLLKTALFAWVVPLLPIIVSLAIDPHNYATYTGTSLNRDFCYPQGIAFYLTVLAPVVIVVATNIVVFIVIMFRIHSWCGWGKLETLERHGLTDRDIAMRRFNTTVLLFFLFGLTWTFGLFARNIVFAYLFCITATMQGFVLFVFLVLLERKTSGYWKTAIADISNKNRSSMTNSQSGSKISETSFKSLPFTK